MESSLCLTEEERGNLNLAKQQVFEGYNKPADNFNTDQDYIHYLRVKLTRAHEFLQKVPSQSKGS
jgi:hypothetical protein